MTALNKRPYDLVGLGEALLRLSPPGRVQLRRTDSLDLVICGSQMNVAADLARLGMKTSFLTRFPTGPLGLLATDYCRTCGVDVGHVQFVDGTRMGVTYVEFSAAPRTPLAIYDRAGSAASTIDADSFEWAKIVGQTRVAYTDGIFPGLSASCRAATAAYLAAAKRAGCTVCFDVNYREHLWTAATARKAWSALLPNVDILVTNPGVSETVFGFRGSDEELMRRYSDEFGCRTVCLTRRESLGMDRGGFNGWALHDGEFFEGKSQEFDVVDRYGTGDAWTAGFLYGYAQRGVQYALDFANAALAVAHTIPGDVLHATAKEIEAVTAGEAVLHARR